MFDEVDRAHLNAGLIVVLAECPLCRTRYAVTPDSFLPGQWAFFQRDRADQPLSHLCSGGLLCLRGHDLVVTLQQAVRTQAGEWLDVSAQAVVPLLN